MEAVVVVVVRWVTLVVNAAAPPWVIWFRRKRGEGMAEFVILPAHALLYVLRRCMRGAGWVERQAHNKLASVSRERKQARKCEGVCHPHHTRFPSSGRHDGVRC